MQFCISGKISNYAFNFWIKIKSQKSLLYQNLLFLFASVLDLRGYFVLLLKGLSPVLFWLNSRFGWQFQGYSFFFCFDKAEMGRSILIYRLNHKYWSAKGLTLRSTQKCWILCACRLPCGIPASNFTLLSPDLPWELLWSYFAFIPEDFLPIYINTIK